MADDTYKTCEDWLTAILADAAIIAHCTTLYGRAPKGYLGLDARKLPDDVCLPWVACWPEQTGAAPSQRVTQEVVRIAVAIRRDEQVTAAGITKLDGLDKVLDYAALVYAKLLTLSRDNIVSYSLVDINNEYPYFTASWTATLGRSTT
jgi:hypothetical protein